MKTILTLLLLQIPFPGPGRAPWGGGGSPTATFKGESHDSQSGSATTITTPGTLNVASGDFIIMEFGSANNATMSASCGGQAMTAGPTWYDATQNYKVAIFYKQNSAADAAMTCTGTVTVAQAFRMIAAANFSGVSTSGGVLQSSCQDVSCNTLGSTSTNRTAQNITTTTANTLLVALGVNWDGGGITMTGANGYSIGINADIPFMAYKSINATGTHPSGNYGTVNISDEYVVHFMSFGLL